MSWIDFILIAEAIVCAFLAGLVFGDVFWE